MAKKQKQYTVKKQEGKYWVVAPSGARIVVPHTILGEARQIARIFNQTKRDEKTVKTFPSASVREARAGLIPSEETDGQSVADNVCQNCDGKFRDDQLEEITHGIWERVSPGELMPSGECPDCGALCHPIQKPIPVTVRLTVIGGVAEAFRVPKGVTVEVHDYDCDGISDAADIKRDRRGDRYLLKVWEGKQP
jgi:hypothetical protein